MKRTLICLICAFIILCVVSCGADGTVDSTAATVESTTVADCTAQIVPTSIRYTKSHMGRTLYKYEADLTGGIYTYTEYDRDGGVDHTTSVDLTSDAIARFYADIADVDITSWGDRYADDTYSGAWWNMTVTFTDNTEKSLGGNILHPDGFDILISAMRSLTCDDRI